MTPEIAMRLVRLVLGPHLLKPEWRKKRPRHAPNSWGCCYIACEAVWHLSTRTLKPYVMKTDVGTHWFLRDEQGIVYDPTADQFEDLVDYSQGRGCGFLTTKPSHRAQIILDELEKVSKLRTTQD